MRGFWRDDVLEADELRRIARWCLDYLEKYDRAPERDIESLYMEHLRSDALGRAEAESIEAVLSRISDDYDRGDQFNAGYLFDQTVRYIREREYSVLGEEIAALTERGRVDEAEALRQSFVPTSAAASRGLEVNTDEGYARIEAAFAEGSRPLVRYPGALGEMLNSHLVRGGFVAFLAPEKRGKTWILLDMAFRALRQRANVAMFQAGDLTEGQTLRRVAIHLARKSDDERYCRPYWRPVGDCVLNQFDVCTRPDRNCDHGVYGPDELEEFRDSPKKYQQLAALAEAAESAAEYRPCDSATCRVRQPAVWLQRQPERSPLTGPAAAARAREFFEKYRRRFRLHTSTSDTLTVAEIESCIHEWERQDDFVPDVVIVDYADLMTAPVSEFRHRIDAVWKGLRGVSQRWHALVATATQADADSYRASTLRLSNFSEDKRKFSHVTAFWGLNQSPDGREKDLGVMRINTLLAREGDFSIGDEVTVLQDLRAGRPVLESFSTGRSRD